MTAADDLESTPRRCRQGNISNDGLEFTACEGTPYLSLDYHQPFSQLRHVKSIWLLSRVDECHAFCEARLSHWSDQAGNYWTVTKDGDKRLLGDRGERMAFFPAPSDETDTWHGFPVGGGKDALPFKQRPPADLVQRWTQEQRISRVNRARINRWVL